jgi:hypothetical protein
MKQSPSWETNRSFARQYIHTILCNMEVHISPPHVTILSQIKPVHDHHTTSWRSILILYYAGFIVINSTRTLLNWNGVERNDPRIFTVLPHHSMDELDGQCYRRWNCQSKPGPPPIFGIFITSQEYEERVFFLGWAWSIYVTAARVWSRTCLSIIQSATKRKEHLPVLRREAVPDRLKTDSAHIILNFLKNTLGEVYTPSLMSAQWEVAKMSNTEN